MFLIYRYKTKKVHRITLQVTFTFLLFIIRTIFSLFTKEITMSSVKTYTWNILCLEQVDARIEIVEKHLHEIHYPNGKGSDDKLIELRK